MTGSKTKIINKKLEQQGMMKGAAIAIGIIGATTNQAQEVATAFGLDRKTAKKNKIDKYDLDLLEPLFQWQENN